jgi:hypothetical protein
MFAHFSEVYLLRILALSYSYQVPFRSSFLVDHQILTVASSACPLRQLL